MPLPDHRMRFPAPAIDFPAQVGTTGQDHDNYPAPDEQARFDWMRMALIALLSNQSSFDEPTQYRDGTVWFDLNTNTFKVRRGQEWIGLADAIQLISTGGTVTTLADLYAMIQDVVAQRPQAIFGGVVQSDTADVIPIPESVRSAAWSGSRPLVWRQGSLLDPRLCQFLGGAAPSSIRLIDTQLIKGDTFTVLITNIPVGMFYAQDVVV